MNKQKLKEYQEGKEIFSREWKIFRISVKNKEMKEQDLYEMLKQIYNGRFLFGKSVSSEDKFVGLNVILASGDDEKSMYYIYEIYQ